MNGVKTRRFEGRFFGARAGRIVWLCALVAALAGVGVSAASTRPPAGGEPLPDVLVITVDTLRADHLSGYGYRRPTSPNLDRLFGAGALFLEARTTEPLTSPALCTMVTGVEPHVHGSTRNGLSMRAGLPSLPKLLSDAGYRTGGFVGNWTLRDRLSGLGGHFERYETLVTRKRWFGLLKGEATGDDLNDALLEWLREIREDAAPRFAWIHYVEPHAPYRAWKEHLPALGLEDGNLSPLDRYDTEIAHVDRVIGDLLAAVRSEGLLRDPIIVFTSDHGESLGEHDYWGHGRNLHEPGLRIPLSITWPGKIDPEQVAGPSLLIDLPRTLASLVGLQAPDAFDGHDWSPTSPASPDCWRSPSCAAA